MPVADLKDSLKTALRDAFCPGYNGADEMLETLATKLQSVLPAYLVGTGAPNSSTPHSSVSMTFYLDTVGGVLWVASPTPAAGVPTWYQLGGYTPPP